MLADQWLRHPERVDQLVHAALRFTQLQNDGDPHGRGERPQQLAGRIKDFSRRWERVIRPCAVSTGVGFAVLVGHHAHGRSHVAIGVIGIEEGGGGDIAMGESHHLEKCQVVGKTRREYRERSTSTVTCMMTHVKDRGADRYHDESSAHGG
jgi:hypothetical protein